MKISHRGLYALKALLHLAEAHDRGLVKIHEIAEEEDIPEKFLEGILVTLKNARAGGQPAGARGRLPPAPPARRRSWSASVVRIMDGPLAPLGDAVELAQRVRTEPRHAGLFDVFLDVRNAAAAILDHTSLADVLRPHRRLARQRGRADADAERLRRASMSIKPVGIL